MAIKHNIMSMVTKLIFALLDVSFNSGHYTVIIKRQFLYINIGKMSIELAQRTKPFNKLVIWKLRFDNGRKMS